MQTLRSAVASIAVVAIAGCATVEPRLPMEAVAAEVLAAESGFARTMAERDLKAFATFIAPEAVFINGGKPLRGRDAVVAHWRRFFEAPAAPFSWRPELVEVTESGTLAYSEGPVALPDGKVTSRFYSIWRLGADGRWRVVFDNGYDLCNCPKP